MKKPLVQKLFLVFILSILLLLSSSVTWSLSPVPDIKINGSDGPVTLNSKQDNVSLTVQLDSAGRTDNADWFIATSTPFGVFFYTLNGWTDLISPIVQIPLQPLPNIQLINFPALLLPSGEYDLYFAVDTDMDGTISWEQLYFDYIQMSIIGPPSASAYIDASKGGTLEVTNTQGDKIELEIPPRALPFSGNITILTHDTPPTSPIADVRFPGVTILPEGLLFEEPARLRITPATPTPSEMLVFGLWRSDLAVPTGDITVYDILQEGDSRVANQSRSLRSNGGGTYQNEVFKGRTYIGGIPSKTEAKTQSDKLIEIPPLSYPNWQAAKEQIRGILVWAEVFMRHNDDATADIIMDAGKYIADQVIQEFLEVPAPANPCNEDYTTLLFELGELTMVGLSHDMPAVDQEFQQRIASVMSLCHIRYELEVKYKWTSIGKKIFYENHLNGRIPISIVIYDVEGLPALGYGELSVTGSGHVGECSMSISGSGDVAVAGRFSFDDVGLPTLLLKLQHDTVETWTQSCPDDPPVSTDFINVWSIADQVLHISPFNGSRITQKHDFGASTYELTWTLHHAGK